MARHDRKAKNQTSSNLNKAEGDNETRNSEPDSSSFVRAGFVRRLLAMIYDTLVATAVGMCAAMVMIVTLVVMLKNGALDLQGYAEPADLIQASFGYKLLIQTWVGLWIAGFFLWFWRRGGQTLGMRAWRLRIYSTVEEPMTWPRLFIRLVASLGGLGTLLVLFDFKNKQSLQDRLAKTEVLKLTKEANDHKSW
ncbi:RDD family protein [Alteromonas sp. KUL106]|uniref:RDD family protein n=1 Tax=Alteromonas sp. KUL106 TaxID=2480799 RepID=UPI0012E554C4|nr:RDD family protein [Alteromonas sp. KUL106]GFD70351.1 RDD family protein [Alteromonas sp. KUL106]